MKDLKKDLKKEIKFILDKNMKDEWTKIDLITLLYNEEDFFNIIKEITHTRDRINRRKISKTKEVIKDLQFRFKEAGWKSDKGKYFDTDIDLKRIEELDELLL